MIKLESKSSEYGVERLALNLVNTKEDPPVLKTQKSATSNAEGFVPQEKVPALPVLVFCASYITFGAVLFSAWEKWTFLEGFYFSFITLTTIGKLFYIKGPDRCSAK